MKVNFQWEFMHDHHKPSYNYNEISEHCATTIQYFPFFSKLSTHCSHVQSNVLHFNFYLSSSPRLPSYISNCLQNSSRKNLELNFSARVPFPQNPFFLLISSAPQRHSHPLPVTQAREVSNTLDSALSFPLQ